MENKLVMKKQTRKEKILFYLSSGIGLTCQQISKRIFEDECLTGNVAHYLSGSVSTLLAKMVKDGQLEYFGVGLRGGHVYRIKGI